MIKVELQIVGIFYLSRFTIFNLLSLAFSLDTCVMYIRSWFSCRYHLGYTYILIISLY